MKITYKDTLTNIIGFNSALLKLKCVINASENGDEYEGIRQNEVKFIRDIMKRSVEYALSSYKNAHREPQEIK